MLKIGVLGAGQMGGGITHVTALADKNVLLFDVAETQLTKGLATISRNLKRQVEKGTVTEDVANAALAQIATTTDLQDFSDSDVIIEAVPEI